MKKLLAILVSALLLLTAVVPAMAENVMGGWTVCEDTTVTEDARDAFDKAMEGFTGVGYTPVALLATQVVAGTNYCLLVRGTMVTASPVDFYALMYIYAGVDGSAEILSIRELETAAPAGTAGGWAVQTGTTEDAATAFAKAMETFVGVGYTPIALLSCQVVAGMNYRFLCRGQAVVPGAEPFYAIVTIYAALDGSAQVTGVQNITLSVDDPAESLAGFYEDLTSGRATMEITVVDGALNVKIFWGNSAMETVMWEMNGVLEGNTISYADCTETVHTVDEKGTETVETVYTDGVGTLTLEDNGTITWQDAADETGKDCVFTATLG